MLALSLTATTAFADNTPGDGHTPGSPAPLIDAPAQPSETTLISGTEPAGTDSEPVTMVGIMWVLTTIY